MLIPKVFENNNFDDNAMISGFRCDRWATDRLSDPSWKPGDSKLSNHLLHDRCLLACLGRKHRQLLKRIDPHRHWPSARKGWFHQHFNGCFRAPSGAVPTFADGPLVGRQWTLYGIISPLLPIDHHQNLSNVEIVSRDSPSLGFLWTRQTLLKFFKDFLECLNLKSHNALMIDFLRTVVALTANISWKKCSILHDSWRSRATTTTMPSLMLPPTFSTSWSARPGSTAPTLRFPISYGSCGMEPCRWITSIRKAE